jgi:hypothetical protein
MASLTTNDAPQNDEPPQNDETSSSKTTPSSSAIKKSTQSYPTDISGKINYAEGIREKGKILYQKKKYKKACRLYAQIPAWVSPFAKSQNGEPNQAEAMTGMMGDRSSQGPQATSEQEVAAKDLLRIAHQNRAMCYIKVRVSIVVIFRPLCLVVCTFLLKNETLSIFCFFLRHVILCISRFKTYFFITF